MISPNFDRFRTVLLRCGEPDYVPLGDVSVHPLLKAAVLGRPLRDLEDEAAFWSKAGYDYVPIEQGLQLTGVIKRESMRELEAHYAVDTSDTQVRSWATEGKGLLATRADLESFRWPDPDALDYSPFERMGRLLPPEVKVIAILGKIFTCVWWLMGLEGMSLALADDPGLVADLCRRVGEFQLRVFQNMLRFDRVGAFWHADDIAFSTQLLVSPRLLRAHVFPWYAEMNRLAHAEGRLAVYHSDGALQEVLTDIVQCGFDGLNPIEPKAMDINAVKREYGRHLSIIGNIDLGYTLTRGTPEEVRAEVRQRIHDLAPGGGYAVASSNSVPEYVPLANFTAMRQATFEYGRYPIAV
ncbi:MAG TPA: uroporphyrinogen decarboxylase family protein [Candidatus Methylomirabilis sp.]|nr:uroporphyrinogen decarboxylase family protein [Candidatus Methylomirabilis sp.]